jgi:DNA-binding beta-propeller fold protein YncE
MEKLTGSIKSMFTGCKTDATATDAAGDGAADDAVQPRICTTAVLASGTTYALGDVLLDTTIFALKQKLSTQCEISVRQQSMYAIDDTREGEDLELKNGETVGEAVCYSGSSTTELQIAVMSGLCVDDVAEFVANMPSAQPALELAANKACYGVAFVPGHLNLVVITSWGNNSVKVYDQLQPGGKMLCQIGGVRGGNGDEQLSHPRGVVVTADSATVVVADNGNNRLQVFKLSVGELGSTAQLDFVLSIGANGRALGQLSGPGGLALREVGGRQTVLVTERSGNRITEFELDGTPVRTIGPQIRCGCGGKDCAPSKPEHSPITLGTPFDVTSLLSSGDIAVAQLDSNTVTVLDGDSGEYLRHFSHALNHPSAITSDPHDNILVLDNSAHLRGYNAQGDILFDRTDLGIRGGVNTKVSGWSVFYSLHRTHHTPTALTTRG